MPSKLTEIEFKNRAEELQGSDIDLSKVVFVNTRTKVTLGCKVCGKEWDILAKVVSTKKVECPYCTGVSETNSAYTEKPMILYFIKILDSDKEYYSFGISSKSVREKFKTNDLRKIIIQKEIMFEKGNEAHNLDQMLKSKYKNVAVRVDGLLETRCGKDFYEVDVYGELVNG